MLYEVITVVPIYRNIFDKLKRIEVLVVGFGQVGSHLQGAVHGYVQGQLTWDGCVCPRIVVRVVFADVLFKNAGRIVSYNFV